MSHETKVVSHEQRGDQFVVWIECCGTHKHPHTVSIKVAADRADLKASVEIGRKEAEKKHDEILLIKNNLDTLVEK